MYCLLFLKFYLPKASFSTYSPAQEISVATNAFPINYKLNILVFDNCHKIL